MAMYKVVFVRHGKTSWADKFTGWTDVDIAPEGTEMTKKFAQRLTDAGFRFDIAHTSYLKRAIRTLWTVLEGVDQMHIPVMTSWRLNERHYGALQGLNKAETAAKYGEGQVKIWRRSFDTPPPSLELSDPQHPRFDQKYAHVAPSELPSAESLKDTIARTIPYWQEIVVPQIQSGKSVLVSAHGNSIRAVAKHIEEISDDEIMGLNIAYSIPLVYEFDDQMKFVKKYYLALDEEIELVISDIKNQGKQDKKTSS